jgi:hydrogenase maturation protein HypF
VVQGVGFRPFVYRLARANTLSGWVCNGEEGVEIHLEGAEPAVDAFLRDLEGQPPPAARIASIDVAPAAPAGLTSFVIRESHRQSAPTVRISPDLLVCDECLRELFDPKDRRFHYPYINCTNCGPRYTIVLGLPYDRCATTMKAWPLDEHCAAQYHDPADRRFHAQPVACPECGPNYHLHLAMWRGHLCLPRPDSSGRSSPGRDTSGETSLDAAGTSARATSGDEAIAGAARLLRDGSIVAIKGLGGYHLACDARNATAVQALRERKFRKEKPFALMARDLSEARRLVELSPEDETLLQSTARPIVLAPARAELPGVAPDNHELGVMLPYTPVHHLFFAHGAPNALVMTSANRSNEPIAYQDADALDRLAGIADAFLIGERPIARQVDDSVVRGGAILRRARGYAPSAVARLPVDRPILAVGADLKNAITLVVDGQAFVSQHVGDLDHYDAFQAFAETIRDLAAMYDVDWNRLLVVHDCHPQYASTAHAQGLQAAGHYAVQHHRAHIASVLAEREEWRERVAGVSLDGTGYGDDGTIWGGEIFVGSIVEGFERVAHLRPALLPGGDAAARFPVQAAAGFLSQLDGLPDLAAAPFHFPDRYWQSLELACKGVRTFTTTSAGRLFDAAAALAGFTRPITFEGQAAMWLEHLAHSSADAGAYPFPLTQGELDFRPLLRAVVDDRMRGEDPAIIARRFHRGLARGLCDAVRATGLRTVVLSGGVFQNHLLLRDLRPLLAESRCEVWTNHAVPANDGGISLGQAALCMNSL